MCVMDGFCGMGRLRICVVSLELDESEDGEDDDDEGEVLPSSLSGSSSEAIAMDSEGDDSADGDGDVLPSDSDPVLGSEELDMEGEAFLLCAVREPLARRAYSTPFSLLVVGGGFEKRLSSDKLFLFAAVAIGAYLI